MDAEKGKREIKIGFRLSIDDEAWNYAKGFADKEGKTVEEFVADRLALAVDKLMVASYQLILGQAKDVPQNRQLPAEARWF